jgi:Spy/CpxP family protein refolding chaperone
MKKRALTITAVVAAVLALAAVPLVYAQTGHMHRMGMGAGMGPLAHLGKLQTELGLSDQQVSQIKTIVAETHQQNAQYRQQLHGGIHAAIAALLKNPNDVAGAQAIIDQQTQAEAALKTSVLNAASKALNVLTPEQRDKLATLMAQHQAKFQNQ